MRLGPSPWPNRKCPDMLMYPAPFTSLLQCTELCICSLARFDLERSSSSGGSLDQKVMDNESLPAASSPKVLDDTEVLSLRIPGQGEMQEAIKAAPEDETLAAGHMGNRSPWGLMMGARFDSAPTEYGSGDPQGSGIRQAASLERRRRAHPTGVLCPTRGTGQSTGSATRRFHCG